MRDPTNPDKTAHLKFFPGAAERLSLFAADLTEDGSFDEPITGCHGVFHVATPVVFSSEDGEREIFMPGMKGLETVLRACAKAGVKRLIFTSSMSAMAPQPPPAVKDESHWSDPDAQKAKGNWYGACKTCQEKAAMTFVEAMPEAERFRLVSICPTMVIGPMHQPSVNATMGRIAYICQGKMEEAPNDSMSFIDVRDCAAHHIAAFAKGVTGRYMSLVESWHWNDIIRALKEIYPPMPEVNPCQGEPELPTQFNRQKMDSLGVPVRDVPTILRDAVAELRAKGALE